MDQLPGTLKPSASEWVPGGGSNTAQQQQFAAQVPRRGEFVPAAQRQQQPAQHHLQQQQQQQQQQQHTGLHQHGGADQAGEHGEDYGDDAYSPYDETFLEAERLVCKACEPLPVRRTYFSQQLPPELRAYFAHSLKLTLQHLPLTDERVKEVPKIFALANPLDDPAKKRGAAGSSGYPTSMFKVVSRKDGQVYALRRVDNVRGVQVLQQQCEATMQIWKRVRHANIIALRQAFVHQRAVFLVHDYWPGAQTLFDYVVTRGVGNLLPEKILWSIATQLLTALRVAHDAKTSFRGGITLQRVLLTGRNRVRIASAGLMHVLEARERSANEDEYMRDDVLGFAKIMLVLCCMSPQALRSAKDSAEFVATRFSKELTALVTLPFQHACSAYDVLALCSRGLLGEIDELYSHSDALEEYLGKQLETSRLNRLLVKLNLVNERPEYGKSEAASWAETGDRYILKLFRDYVFHQTDETGQPWLDIGHIFTSLNKLDIGSTERILLTSRDGRSILVVSFADVRKCLEDAFRELVDGHRSTQYYQEKRANPHRMGRPAAHQGAALHMGAPGQGMHPHAMHALGGGAQMHMGGFAQGAPGGVVNPYMAAGMYDPQQQQHLVHQMGYQAGPPGSY